MSRWTRNPTTLIREQTAKTQQTFELIKSKTSLNKRFTCTMVSVTMFLLMLTFIGPFVTTLLGELFMDMHPPTVSRMQLMYYHNAVLGVMIFLALLVAGVLIGFLAVMIRNLQLTAKHSINTRFSGVLAPLEKPLVRFFVYMGFFLVMLILGTTTIQALTCADNVELKMQAEIWGEAARDYDSRMLQTMAASEAYFRGMTMPTVLGMSGMIVYNTDNSTTFMGNQAVTSLQAGGNIVNPNGLPVPMATLNTIMSYGLFTPKSTVGGKYTIDDAMWINGGQSYSSDPAVFYVNYALGMNMPAEPRVSNKAAGRAFIFLVDSFRQPVKKVLTALESLPGELDFKLATATTAIRGCYLVGVYSEIFSGIVLLVFIIGVILLSVGYVFKKGPVHIPSRKPRHYYPQHEATEFPTMAPPPPPVPDYSDHQPLLETQYSDAHMDDEWAKDESEMVYEVPPADRVYA